MSRRRSPLSTVTATLAAVVALVLLASSCMDGATPVGSLSDVGVVEGRITEAGVPLAAQIHFETLIDSPLSANVTVQADTNGWYRAELPLGLYGYNLRVDNQTAPWDSGTDTLQVGRAVRRLDLARGRARVVIRIPAALGSSSAILGVNAVRRYHHGQAWGPHGQAGSAVENERAEFDLRLLPPAVYRMVLDCQGGPSGIVVPMPGTVDTPDSLRVGVDAIAGHEFDFRPRYASIAGRVSGGPESALGGFRVDAWNALQRRIASAYVAEDGTYRLDFLNSEPVRVRTYCGEIDQWYGGADWATAAVVDVQPGSHLDGVDFAGGELRIGFEGPGARVTNAADVVLVDPEGREYEVPNFEQYPLRIENLRAGQWRLYVSGTCAGEPWQPQWWQNAADAAHATPLTIVAGQSLDVTVTLSAGGSVSGTLVRRPGSSLWTSAITPCDLDGRPVCGNPVLFWNDEFELVGVPDGQYLLALFVTATPWWYPGTWERAEADTVRVVDGGRVTGLSWVLPFPYKEATR